MKLVAAITNTTAKRDSSSGTNGHDANVYANGDDADDSNVVSNRSRSGITTKKDKGIAFYNRIDSYDPPTTTKSSSLSPDKQHAQSFSRSLPTSTSTSLVEKQGRRQSTTTLLQVKSKKKVGGNVSLTPCPKKHTITILEREKRHGSVQLISKSGNLLLILNHERGIITMLSRRRLDGINHLVQGMGGGL